MGRNSNNYRHGTRTRNGNAALSARRPALARLVGPPGDRVGLGVPRPSASREGARISDSEQIARPTTHRRDSGFPPGAPRKRLPMRIADDGDAAGRADRAAARARDEPPGLPPRARRGSTEISDGVVQSITR